MTLLAFTSDWQLGSGSDYGSVPYGPGSRLEDQRQVLGRLTARCYELGVAEVIHAGDVFEHRAPTPRVLDVWREWLATGPECRVVLGNHDISAPGEPTAASLFAYVHARPQVVAVPGAILGVLPWAPGDKEAAAADVAPADRAEWVAHRLQQAAQALALDADAEQRVQEQRTLQPWPKVLVLHWGLSGSQLPTGLPTGTLREPVLDTQVLANQGWDYIFGGHIHHAQELAAATPTYVLGSPYICDFAEAELPHGFWVLDTEARKVWLEQLTGRKFVTLDYEARSGNVLGPFSSEYAAAVAGAVVRVRIRGDEQGVEAFDVLQMRRELYAAGAHKVYAIQQLPERGVRARVEAAQAGISPAEGAAMWAAAQDPPLDADAAAQRTAEYLAVLGG